MTPRRPSTPSTPDEIFADHSEADTDRRALHVVLCEHAYQGLADFADSGFVSMTGLIDAIGHYFATQPVTEQDHMLLDLAQRFDADRQLKLAQQRRDRRRQ